MKGRMSYILTATMVFIGVLYGVDQLFQVNYILKSLMKVFMLFVIIYFYNRKFKVNIIGNSIDNYRNSKRPRAIYILGIGVLILIPLVYLSIAPYLDEPKILLDFEQKYKITKENFLFYGIYLSVVNAMFEELFFRGFIFLELCKMNRRGLAYLFSAGSFSVYHLANITGWSNPFITAAALLGLLAGGMMFNYLDEKNQTFLNSYFVHFCSDVGIVVAGAMMFWGLA